MMSTKLGKMLMVILLLLAAGTLQAGTYTLTSDTTGSLLWNRPDAGAPPTVLSVVGTSVPEIALPFFVDSSGLYVLETIAPTAFDTYLFLYQTSFNPQPGNQLTNVLAGDDDSGGGLLSLLNYNLAAYTQYYMVVTGYANIDSGPCSAEIQGPGNISTGVPPAPVPEPSTMLLLGSGLAGLIGYGRRRLKK